MKDNVLVMAYQLGGAAAVRIYTKPIHQP